jgi:DNA-directed RNA polymerase subunit RPC12/RpoP
MKCSNCGKQVSELTSDEFSNIISGKRATLCSKCLAKRLHKSGLGLGL